MAKLTRKELLKGEDAFQNVAAQSAEWLAEHRRTVIVYSVIGFLLIAAVWGGMAWFRDRNSRASLALGEALETMNARIVAEGETAAADDVGPTFPTEEARRDAARQKLNAVIDGAGGSDVADIARLYLGDLQQEAGDIDGAVATFAALVDSLGVKDSLYFIAVERLVYLQEKKNELDQAIATLSRLTSSDEAFYRDVAMYHQARLYAAKGDVERARNLLESVEKDFPKSPVADEVKQRLAMIGRSAPKSEPAPDQATP